MIQNTNHISPYIDIASAKKQLTTNSRLVIKDFLLADYAEKIYQCLENDVPWQIAFRDEETNHVLEREQLDQMGPEKRAQLIQQIVEMAKHRYQFLYNRYPIVDAVLEGRNPDLFLNQVVEYFNSSSYLNFFHQLTNDAEIKKCSAQATWYAPGNFLNYHTDVGSDEEDRRFAYVLNLSKEWRPDWGGLLHFVDEDKNTITETFIPKFNSLSIFKVPQGHYVSYVAPYTMKPRFSITGWFRAD